VLKKIAIGVLLLLLVAMGAMVVVYRIEGQPLPEASQYLEGASYAATTEADGTLLFTPARPSGHGLLIMPGALVQPLAYARTAAFFADLGYTVLVPRGALRLPINAVEPAAARMAELGMDDWFIIGHSMGGFAGLELVARHAPVVKAVALWGCEMPVDYSSLEVPMLFIRGDHDGLLTDERFAAVQARLPATVRYITLPGGNHRGFALYSHQLFDNPATISTERQVSLANDRTARFFAARF